MQPELKGIMPAIASPCDDDDRFLEDSFAELAVNLYGQGVHGLYVCGGTGDGYNMRLDERKRAARIAADVSAQYGGRIIVHAGTSNTRDSTELAVHAAEVGAAAVSSIPPINRSQQQLIDYYTDLTRACGIPVMIYYIPAVTHHHSGLDEVLEILDIDGVVGFKFTDWNLFLMKRLIVERPGITVFNGYDEMLLPALLYGAGGGIGTWYNLFPKLFLGIYGAVAEGELARALDLQNRLLSFSNVAWRHGAAVAFELLMRERGFAPNCFRRPRARLDGPIRERLIRDLAPLVAAIEEC